MATAGGAFGATSAAWCTRLNLAGTTAAAVAATTGSMTGGDFGSPLLAGIGARGGKTNLLRFLAAQQLRHGWPVDFVDLADEHGWADGLPTVTRWTSVAAAEAGLVGLHENIEQRERAAVPAKPRLLLIDDIDVLLPQLEARWSERRRPGDPAMGPAVTAWAEVWLRGRGLAIHPMVTASRPDRAFWADMAGTRIVGAGAPQSVWDALAPEVEPPPDCGLAHPGRVCVLNPASEPTEAQTIWITDQEARDFATNGAIDG
jgi:hypothetical protein